MGRFKQTPKIDLGDNVRLLNQKAETYHIALKAAQNDLYCIFCHDLWGEPALATKEASEAFVERFKGKCAYMIVPVDSTLATQIGDTVLVASEVAELKLPERI